jgi:hypothetical protein
VGMTLTEHIEKLERIIAEMEKTVERLKKSQGPSSRRNETFWDLCEFLNSVDETEKDRARFNIWR